METHQIAGWLGLKKSHFPKAVQRPWFSFIGPVFLRWRDEPRNGLRRSGWGANPTDGWKWLFGRLALLACWGSMPFFYCFVARKKRGGCWIPLKGAWQETLLMHVLKIHMNKHLMRNNRHPLIHAQWCTHTSTVHVDKMTSWHRGWPPMNNWSLHSIIMGRFCSA